MSNLSMQIDRDLNIINAVARAEKTRAERHVKEAQSHVRAMRDCALKRAMQSRLAVVVQG
ncbi:hypothetical protein [Lacticaseibacillus kribbianus]|uniref:hypothetical protein n=1 Tax=Lacticaseibacillus kribbianus TaxID=2926292 RepID=UPI001CD51DFD|nr:hypothetical protein [Lacticaseibacillus kribbianus]